MKMIRLLASTALVASSISPAFADTIPEPVAAPTSSITLAAMQNQCTSLAVAHDTDGIGTGDRWTGEVVLGDDSGAEQRSGMVASCGAKHQ